MGQHRVTDNNLGWFCKSFNCASVLHLLLWVRFSVHSPLELTLCLHSLRTRRRCREFREAHCRCHRVGWVCWEKLLWNKTSWELSHKLHASLHKYLLNINKWQDTALGFTGDMKRSEIIFTVNKLVIFLGGVLVSVLLLWRHTVTKATLIYNKALNWGWLTVSEV